MFHRKANAEQNLEDSYNMIIGSSNLTQTALTVNREWNVQLSSMKNGALIKQMQQELEQAWNDATVVDEAWISAYETIYKQAKTLRRKDNTRIINLYQVNPNKMQVDALSSLADLRKNDKDRALLISATGTGKTFLSAFDVKVVAPKRFLFVVHRNQIARKAKESFEKVIGRDVEMGMFSGSDRELEKPYLFATVQTLSREEHLKKFSPEHFDYIVIDEVHRAGADTYQKIINYFKPKFLLGMTATPERTDGYDIFKDFNYNIAYEIRLNQALEENMLVPFHYHGISEVQVNGTVLDEHSDFNRLTCDERVKHILHYADFYGCDEGRVKGLVFCSRKDEAVKLAEEFCKNGKKAIALTGDTSNDYRTEVVERLERDDIPVENQIDYIFTVDIFNEGIDIPCVNQIIMLRPTQSPIVFVQQLGRGLRKAQDKEYVIILDFIGNYNNNFMIPVALSGDRSYNPDIIRKYVISGNSTIPGASTVHFDEIAKEKIFSSIDKIKGMKSIIKSSYMNLKNRLGRIPYLVDFYENGEVDPLVIIREYKTYQAFLESEERELYAGKLYELEVTTLEYLSKTVLSGTRPYELEILKRLMEHEVISMDEIKSELFTLYGYAMDMTSFLNAVDVLQGRFVSKEEEYQKYRHIEIVNNDDEKLLRRVTAFAKRLLHEEFKHQVKDIIEVGLRRYHEKYNTERTEESPFVLYEKYSRRDVCLLMNCGKDLSSTMFGMKRIDDDVFIFVTYHKQESKVENELYVAGKPDYADAFEDNVIFKWDSQMGKGVDSSYMGEVRTAKRKHLLVKKSDAETNFYYMGLFDILDVRADKKEDKNGKLKDIAKVTMRMRKPVRDDLLRYLQSTIQLEGDKAV